MLNPCPRRSRAGRRSIVLTPAANLDQAIGFTITQRHARGRLVRLGPVLDALKACGVKATFFVIADFCSTYARRQLLGRAVRPGVEVNQASRRR